MQEYMIECHQLTKTYHKVHALDHLNLNIAKGEIFGLIGRNGSGKSTMMKLIGGLIHPSEGEFKLFGKYPHEDPYLYRRVGTLIEEPGIYDNMSAIENMRVKALAMGCDDKLELMKLLEICGLDATSKKKAGKFSLGMKQRLGLALAMVGNPELLILDEPVNGLDPQGIMDIRNAILRINQERQVTIVISSHILEELSKIATCYGIIKDGVLIQHLTSDELFDRCKDYCQLVVEDTKQACVVLEDSCHVYDYKVIDHHIIQIYDTVETAMINEVLIKNDVRVCEIMMHQQKLEAYFLDITGGDDHVE